jgi:AcrR family transcriptional regulator
MDNTETIETLYKVAKDLFLREGYKKTTIRKIAEHTGISIGLVIYHFSAKRHIAVKIILEQFRMLQDIVREYVNLHEDPMLYTAVLIRLNRYVWWSWYRDFYLETLDSDIYTEAIELSGMRSSIELVKKLNLNNHDDYIDFYFNYLPVSIERSLTLSKERGLLQKIEEDDIPDFIFRSSVDRFVTDKQAIETTCQVSRRIVKKILSAEKKQILKNLV